MKTTTKPRELEHMNDGVVRTFSTGANRDLDEDKFDYEGFVSAPVLLEFGAYMHENRKLKDGSLRDSDNWQKGIPQDVYMKSAWRHFLDWWLWHRGYTRLARENKKKAICGLLFNAMGYLHEALREERDAEQIDRGLGYHQQNHA